MKKLQLTFFLLCIAVSTMVQWSTSSTNIYNMNSGNVGIGTTNPTSVLDVKGVLSLRPKTNDDAWFHFYDDDNVKRWGWRIK